MPVLQPDAVALRDFGDQGFGAKQILVKSYFTAGSRGQRRHHPANQDEVARLQVTQVKEKLSIAEVTWGQASAVAKGMTVHLP